MASHWDLELDLHLADLSATEILRASTTLTDLCYISVENLSKIRLLRQLIWVTKKFKLNFAQMKGLIAELKVGTKTSVQIREMLRMWRLEQILSELAFVEASISRLTAVINAPPGVYDQLAFEVARHQLTLCFQTHSRLEKEFGNI